MDNSRLMIVEIVTIFLLLSINSSATSYVYGLNGLIAMVNESGNITYYPSDHLGSPQAITDEQGEVM